MSKKEKQHIYLTASQCRYLHLGPSADGQIVPQGDLVITMTDDKGWIFVENTMDLGSEGSGVWVDGTGREQYGPVAMGNRKDDG